MKEPISMDSVEIADAAMEIRVTTECVAALRDLGFSGFDGRMDTSALETARTLLVTPYERVMDRFYSTPVNPDKHEPVVGVPKLTRSIIAAQGAFQALVERRKGGKPFTRSNPVEGVSIKDALAVACVVSPTILEESILYRATEAVKASPTAKVVLNRLNSLKPTTPRK